MQFKRIAIKDHRREIQLITRRAIALFVIIIILIGVVLARLAYLQLIKNDLYSTLSKKNSLDVVPIEPTRGLIYDRNGLLIAENIPVYSLDIIPSKVINLKQKLSELTKIISLTDTEIALFQKQLKQHRRFEEIPLKMRLSESEVAAFYENQYRFPGFMIKARLMRYYPLGQALSHILGFVGRINTQELNDIDLVNYSGTNYIGKLGIEKYYEDELHGNVGYQQVENDASGEAIRVIKEIKPVAGQNLYLSIDVNLQLVAEQAMEGARGAVVAIQPSTGQVLALVSQPSYDPNLFVDGISSKDYQTLQNSSDRPLYNRALRGLYPLASTIKPYIALQALNTGITDTRYEIFDPGWFKLKNSEHVFHDYKRHGHGYVNISSAIMQSCDTYFYDIATRMGIQRIDDILNQFGFGKITGIDVGEELPGVVASPAWKRKFKGAGWYPGDTVISGIGQGFMQATPLQLACAVAALSNRGLRYIPYFVMAEQTNGKMVPEHATALSPVILKDPNYWNIVIDAMQTVITSPMGTGYRFGKNVAYTVAAKTGTAQVFSKKHYDENESHDQSNLPERLRDHSLFIAFAPVDHPQIAVAVIVENSVQAASIARKVLDFYLLGKRESTEKTPQQQNE